MPLPGPTPWFLGKDEKLHECLSHQEAATVLRSKGILYLPESTSTTLVFVLALDRMMAKEVVHRPENFKVDLVFDGLEYSQVLDWGFYQLDKMIDAHWSSQALIDWNATGAFGGVRAPHYFRPEGSRKPFVVTSTLLAAVLKDKDGKRIASYKRNHDYGELVTVRPTDPVLQVATRKAPKRKN